MDEQNALLREIKNDPKTKTNDFKIVQTNLKSYHYFRTNFPKDFEKMIVFY